MKLNLEKMMKAKDKSVTVLTKGVEFLLKKNKVTYYKGLASFKSKNEILIKDNHIASSDLKSLVLKAIKNKDKYSGATIHKVSQKLDSGKIILQKKFV